MTRYFYRAEVDENGVERRFSVAYQYDYQTGVVSYGASVFRKDSTKDLYQKSTHRNTANQRLLLRPVHITVDFGTKLSGVESRIREAIRSYGVSGKRQK
jgi:hypothetical protein